MPLGSVAAVVVCDAAATSSGVFQGGINQPKCTLPDGRVGLLVVRQAYVLSPAAESHFEAVAAPFDYVLAGSIWSLAFTFVVGLYLVSKSAGTVLAMIRR